MKAVIAIATVIERNSYSARTDSNIVGDRSICVEGRPAILLAWVESSASGASFALHLRLRLYLKAV